MASVCFFKDLIENLLHHRCDPIDCYCLGVCRDETLRHIHETTGSRYSVAVFAIIFNNACFKSFLKMSAMNFGSKSFKPRAPDKGAFPIDHFGEKKHKMSYKTRVKMTL